MIPLVVAIVLIMIRNRFENSSWFVAHSIVCETQFDERRKTKHIQIEIHDVNGFKCKVWFHFRLCLLILVLFEIVI